MRTTCIYALCMPWADKNNKRPLVQATRTMKREEENGKVNKNCNITVQKCDKIITCSSLHTYICNKMDWRLLKACNKAIFRQVHESEDIHETCIE